MKLYKVSFTFSESYSHKSETFCNISLVVSAGTQFEALAVAWERISSLRLDEPKSFSAEKVSKD